LHKTSGCHRKPKILLNTKAALGPTSKILIDEMVLPDQGVHWGATQIDMLMMACHAALERTEEQWYTLLDRAGLKVQKIWGYTGILHQAVIEVVPA